MRYSFPAKPACGLALGLGCLVLPLGAFELTTNQQADGKVMVRWETVPGLVDTLQMSGDLVNWGPTVISLYGVGTACAVHVFTAQVPGQPPPPPPSSLPRVVAKMLWVTTFKDPAPHGQGGRR